MMKRLLSFTGPLNYKLGQIYFRSIFNNCEGLLYEYILFPTVSTNLFTKRSIIIYNSAKNRSLKIGVIGAGIVGACTAWALSRRGHNVTLIERDKPMMHTSSATSKLIHGGLRYLETGQFSLVRKSLQARTFWLKQAPHLCRRLKLLLPVYKDQGRPRWILRTGMTLYDFLALGSGFPGSQWMSRNDVLECSPDLKSDNLIGAYSFYDAQMDDKALGNWVIEQTMDQGTILIRGEEITSFNSLKSYDRIVNATGPWVMNLRRKQPGNSAYILDWVRGSHIVLNRQCKVALLLQVPSEQRIFFVLPYQGNTLVGTTEIRQETPLKQDASREEIDYLLNAYNYYLKPIAFSEDIIYIFSGVRPLIKSPQDPTRESRNWAFERVNNVLHIYGGKWTTARLQGEEAAERILR